jgi:predicted nucleic acid-binding protein
LRIEEEKGKGMNDRYLLDTSAILTLWNDEEGASDVESILKQAESSKVIVYASFMTYMEAYYRVYRVEGIESAKSIYAEIGSLPIFRLDPNEQILLRAGFIKANYSLSVADAWIIASAIEMDAILVHKDPEYEQLKDTVNMLILPYKSSK